MITRSQKGTEKIVNNDLEIEGEKDSEASISEKESINKQVLKTSRSCKVNDMNLCTGSVHGETQSMISAHSHKSKSSVAMNNLRERQRIEKLRMIKALELKELEDQLECAKLREAFSDEDEEVENCQPVGKVDTMSRYLKDCEDSVNKTEVAGYKRSEPQMSQTRIDLPKVELRYFDGKEADYWKFIRQFDNYIERHVVDSAQRLIYLMNYCRGDARLAIEGCDLIEPREGYLLARRILDEEFGKSRSAVKSCLSSLIDLPHVRPHDVDALFKLAMKMRSCEITLRHMNRGSKLEEDSTLECIVRKLPLDLREKWARRATKIERSGEEVKFADLYHFIKDIVEIAKSDYGMLARPKLSYNETRGIVSTRSFGGERPGPSRVVNFVKGGQTARKLSCIVCNEDHHISGCPRYGEMGVSQRWDLMKELRACYCCLGRNHQAASCMNKKVCGIDRCPKTHHGSLHLSEREVASNTEEKVEAVCNWAQRKPRGVWLGVIPVTVTGPEGERRTYAILDNGSEATLIKESLAQSIGIRGTVATIRLCTMTGERSLKSQRCSFRIQSTDGAETIEIKDAFTTQSMPAEMVTSSPRPIAERLSHLEDIEFPIADGKDIELLIGNDNPEAHWPIERRLGSGKQPYAVKTLLGWCLFGSQVSTSGRKSVLCTMIGEESIWEHWKLLYNQEFNDLGNVEPTLSVEEKLAVHTVTKGTRYIDGHFEVPLPWRLPRLRLPNNIGYVNSRLMSLKKRFHKHPGLLEKYDAIIRSHLEKGYVREVSEEVDDKNGPNAWYLPHHPVFHPKKPNKVRIVFDCAARYEGKSLNDYLHSGPDTISSLIGVLMRFRRFPVAIVADIEEMFLQVKVPHEDSQALRFLWWENGKTETNPKRYLMTVHPFGATSSPFCANFALQRAVEKFGGDMDPVIKQIVTRDIYVDDCIASLEYPELAMKAVSEISGVLKKAGFRMRKWMSNSRKVLSCVPESEVSCSVLKVEGPNLPTERALGIEWNADRDELSFTFTCDPELDTRRAILSCVSTLFDPLGLVAPLTLPVKILLQDLCKKNMGWDQRIGEDDLKRWTNWAKAINEREPVTMIRCIDVDNEHGQSKCQLHVFSDASERGYGAAIYVRKWISGAEYKCELLFAKARVAPLKTVTIPRLELTAAVLAVRMYRFVCKEMGVSFERAFFWTDSHIVLKYISNTKSKFCTFVANRLTEIQENSEPNQWRHVSSEQNPADYASRGGILIGKEMQLWTHGPAFLQRDCKEWPPESISNDQLEMHLEYKKAMANTIIVEKDETFNRLWEHYSEWIRLQRAVSWWVRYKAYLRTLAGGPCRVKLGLLTVEELQASKEIILRMIQMECFPEEYRTLQETSSNRIRAVWRSSPLRKLCVVLMGDLIRVGGRLKDANNEAIERQPILLPRTHKVTLAIIRHYHLAEGHSGVSHVLAAIRREYWIPQGTAAVKHVIGKCLICKKRNTRVSEQLMAPLPVARVEEGWQPFKYVGVDYFGPFTVKRGRRLEKRYGCLFTCLQCRAVHVEVTCSLSTDSFILALIRFFSRRGKPTELYSDNGGNLVGAQSELKDCIQGWSQETVHQRLTSEGVKWHFRPPAASHRGGVWERMIRSIRRILIDTVGLQTLDDETLTTYMIQAERIVNDRPLVPLRDDCEESRVLRPSDLLRPIGEELKLVEISYERVFTKRWRQVGYLTTVFWKRWIREYLPTLQMRQKWITPRRNFQEGDLVLIADKATARIQWPMGVVEEAQIDKDGLVRTVEVRIANGRIRRDVRGLCLLEGAEVGDIEQQKISRVEYEQSIGNPQRVSVGGVEESTRFNLRGGSGIEEEAALHETRISGGLV